MKHPVDTLIGENGIHYVLDGLVDVAHDLKQAGYFTPRQRELWQHIEKTIDTLLVSIDELRRD